MKDTKLIKTEQWIFYFMCGFALFSSLSVAGENIFLGLGLAAFLYRLYLKHDDIMDMLRLDRSLTLAVAGVMATALLSALFSGDTLRGLRLFVEYYGYRMAGLYIVMVTIRDRNRLRFLAGFALASFMINNLHCVWSGLLQPGRAIGFLHPFMSTAGSLSIGTVLFLLLGIRAKTGRLKILYWCMFFLSVMALLYNESRGAWIAIALTALVTAYVVSDSKKKYLAACLVTILILGGVFAGNTTLQQRAETITEKDHQSNAERIRIWTSSYYMFLDHPVLGVGFGQYESAYQTQYILPSAKERSLGHAHSNVMQMLGERGALGCAAFLWMWGYFMYFGVRGWRREGNIVYMAFFSIVMGLMLQGLTEYNMGNSVVTKLFWFSLGICLQWIRLSREEKVK